MNDRNSQGFILALTTFGELKKIIQVDEILIKRNGL